MKKYQAVGTTALNAAGDTSYPVSISLPAGTYEVWVGLDLPSGGQIDGSLNGASSTTFPLEPVISHAENINSGALNSKGIFKLTSDGTLTLALHTTGGSSVTLNHVAISAEALTT